MSFAMVLLITVIVVLLIALSHVLLHVSLGSKINAAVDKATTELKALATVHHASTDAKILAVHTAVTVPIAAPTLTLTQAPAPLNPAFDPSKNPAAALLSRSGMAGVANRDAGALTTALTQTGDPALALAAAKEVGKLLVMNDTQAGAITFCKTLPSSAIEQVRAAFLDPAGLYSADQAGYDKNRASQQVAYEAAWVGFNLR